MLELLLPKEGQELKPHSNACSGNTCITEASAVRGSCALYSVRNWTPIGPQRLDEPGPQQQRGEKI